jgi:hypothetical protein
MAAGIVPCDAPATHATYSTPVDVGHMWDKWAQVVGATSGSHTLIIQGTIDGTNYVTLTGSGAAMQLPTSGNITVDGIYEIPANVWKIQTSKTDADDAAVIEVRIRTRTGSS